MWISTDRLTDTRWTSKLVSIEWLLSFLMINFHRLHKLGNLNSQVAQLVLWSAGGNYYTTFTIYNAIVSPWTESHGSEK